MSSHINGVMLQGFHWFLKPDFPDSRNRSLWQFLRDEAARFRAIGIDAVWIPPAYKAAANRSNSVGYDVYDCFDLGEFIPDGETTPRTKYGTKPELVEAVRSLHGNGTQKRIQVYADVVLNHKTGGQEDDYWQAIRVEKDNRSTERWGEGFERGAIEIKAYTKFDYGAKGAMAVVINTAYGAVKAIRMNTGRFNQRFYHLATIKLGDSGFVVVRNRYDLYGDKAEGLRTDANGWADFLADGGTASIWIEDGVGLDG